MRITIPALAAAISLTVFACTESPSSPPTDDSSSSGGVPSSSSSALGIAEGRACEYPGENFGLSGLFACDEWPGNAPNLQKHRAECEEDGSAWVNACPSGEKATCIYEEDEDSKDLLIKLYAEGFSCGDLSLKNADGSEDIVLKGGACGPFAPDKSVPLSMCIEFPELPAKIIELSCLELEVPFANECPGSSDLICYEPEDGVIYHLYGEVVRQFTCESFGMEEL